MIFVGEWRAKQRHDARALHPHRRVRRCRLQREALEERRLRDVGAGRPVVGLAGATLDPLPEQARVGSDLGVVGPEGLAVHGMPHQRVDLVAGDDEQRIANDERRPFRLNVARPDLLAGRATERDNLFKRNPKTIFVAAHMGWHANDLPRLGKMFDAMPNVYGELGAVLYDIGRQPRSASSRERPARPP